MQGTIPSTYEGVRLQSQTYLLLYGHMLVTLVKAFTLGPSQILMDLISLGLLYYGLSQVDHRCLFLYLFLCLLGSLTFFSQLGFALQCALLGQPTP